MIMEAREKRLSTPLQWGRREKTAVGSALALLLVALIALGIYGLTSGSPARADCVRVTFPSHCQGESESGDAVSVTGSSKKSRRPAHKASPPARVNTAR